MPYRTDNVSAAVKVPPVTTCLPSDLALVEGAGADVPCAEVLGTDVVTDDDNILDVIAEMAEAVAFETITGPRVAGRAVARG